VVTDFSRKGKRLPYHTANKEETWAANLVLANSRNIVHFKGKVVLYSVIKM
jgi:hypothetical protein